MATNRISAIRNPVAQLLAIAWILLDLCGAWSQDSIPVADTSSPRATLRSFVDSCNEFHELIESTRTFDRTNMDHMSIARRILDCIDTSELPTFAIEERAGEVAVCLKEILDRHQFPEWDEVPDSEAIEAAGGFEKLSRWRVPGTRVTIARVEEGAQKHEYLFSSGTVARAVDYYHDVASKPYRTSGPATSPGFYRWFISAPGRPFVARLLERFPDSVRFGRTLGLANWKWPGLFVGALISLVLIGLCYQLQAVTARWTEGRRPLLHLLTLVFSVLAILIPFAFQDFAKDVLTVRGTPLYVISFVATAVAILASMVAVFAASNRITEAVIASPRVNSRGLNAQLIRIASKLLALAIATIVFMVGGQYLGIPVATLLASAGIGGLALALGAQDTLRTLFGTVMLMADKPFRVGERIIFKGYDGVVEDIGLRSTRIRLLNSHQVSIPNDELSRLDIENVGRRTCIRRVADVRIPLETPSEKILLATDILRTELENHEGMNPEFPPRIYFYDFLPDAFIVRVMYWYFPPDYWQYMAFSERFNLAMFRAFEKHDISFSLPTRIAPASTDRDDVPIEIKMAADPKR